VASHSGAKDVHHCDVISVALEHLAEGLAGGERALLLAKFGAQEWSSNGRSGGPIGPSAATEPTPRPADSPRLAP
jgi:hypothetical protein